MWNRQEVKQKGKENFRKQYWKAVVIALLLTILGGSSSSISSSSNQADDLAEQMGQLPDEIATFIGIGSVVLVIVLLLVSILVLNPLRLGCTRYFLRLQHEEPSDWNVGYFFSNSWANVVKTMFFKDLFVFLWTLLLIIPGIIKAYQYRLVSYLLIENPDIDYHDALQESKRLMDGNKWASFVLDLSFILWHILNGITFGIVGLFWLNPYLESTEAQLYCTIRDLDRQNGMAW